MSKIMDFWHKDGVVYAGLISGPEPIGNFYINGRMDSTGGEWEKLQIVIDRNIDQDEPDSTMGFTEDVSNASCNYCGRFYQEDQDECSHCESCFKWFVEVNEPWDVPIKYSKKWKETKEQPEIEELDISEELTNRLNYQQYVEHMDMIEIINDKFDEIIRYLHSLKEE